MPSQLLFGSVSTEFYHAFFQFVVIHVMVTIFAYLAASY